MILQSCFKGFRGARGECESGIRSDARRGPPEAQGQARGHRQLGPEVDSEGALQPVHQVQAPQLSTPAGILPLHIGANLQEISSVKKIPVIC